MKVALDTHAVLWWQAGGRKLSRSAARTIARSDRVLVSAISFWEISSLVAKGRVDLGRATYRWADDFLTTQPAEEIDVDRRIAITAGRLLSEGFHGDPADAIIYATAREHAVALVTKDRRISDFARGRRDVEVVW